MSNNRYEASKEYKWCVEHTGSIWKIEPKEKDDPFETVSYAILCRLDRERFVLISDSGNRWDDPTNALVMYGTLQDNECRLNYTYKLMENKFSIIKSLKPAYQVLFTESDDD